MPPSGTVRWYGRAPEHSLVTTQVRILGTSLWVTLAPKPKTGSLWHQRQKYSGPIPDKTNDVPTRRTKNRLWMIDGVCMLTGSPAHPDQESDSSSKRQPENCWSNPSVWIFPPQTMKLNMRSSYSDWALQPP
ncbi:hypothetical protein VitviT2T_018742 [Vitis vinifera]|uniref:Uncharacterized protein n=1 Tax=Vitis vinifera TaxID=29760 RepID=A0ABY9CZ11_VITVI|nr:hypothetical protein VitviT2T_018742 [Vitis vinifera]